MRLSTLIACLLFVIPAFGQEKPKQIVIAASTVFDGKGGVVHNTRIVIQGSKIVRIDPKAGPVDYDLQGLTVLPGWIDSHVHISWIFGPDGKSAGGSGTSKFAAEAAAANAKATLMAGFTTVQSVGSPTDLPLRDAIAKGTLTGPRILSSAQPLLGQGDQTGTPDQIRAFVRQQKEAGADLIKIFAAGSVRRPEMLLSQEQPDLLAEAVADSLATRLVEDIRALGLPAERSAGAALPEVNDLVIEGDFVRIDEGSRLKRFVIGFGVGATELRTQVRVFQVTAEGWKPVKQFETVATGSRLPGAGFFVAGGAAAGTVVTSAATSSGVGVLRELRVSIDADARRTAEQIAGKVSELKTAQGW